VHQPWHRLKPVGWRRALRALAGRRPGSPALPAATQPGLGVERVRGVIDAPAEEIVGRWHVTFEGWALVGSRAPEAVEIILNDTVRRRASTGLYRPDIPRNLGESAASDRCGWTVDIDLGDLPAGLLRVQAITLDAQGEQVFAERFVTLSGDGFACAIDEGRDGGSISGDSVVIRGWAVIGWRYPARIDVEVDGAMPVPAQIRMLRENPEALPPLRNRPMAGFVCRQRLPHHHVEAVDIEITVVGPDGAFVRLPIIRQRRVAGAVSCEPVVGDLAPGQPSPEERRRETERFRASFDRATARRELGIPAETTLLLGCGPHGARHNHFAAVEAFSEVTGVHPSAALAIIGGAGPYADALDALIADANLAPRVLVLPSTVDERSLIAMSDLVVLASDGGTQTATLSDAMVLGVPALVPDTREMQALIEDGVNGWLFGRNDLRALTACMHRVLSIAPEQRSLVGHAARARG
jgi:glycosyltransferase involved in cell wall biosynthesis